MFSIGSVKFNDIISICCLKNKKVYILTIVKKKGLLIFHAGVMYKLISVDVMLRGSRRRWRRELHQSDFIQEAPALNRTNESELTEAPIQ